MTHEELLAKIDKQEQISIQMMNMTMFEDLKLVEFDALRAVVELHKPWEGTRLNPDAIPNGPWCTHCEEVFDGSIEWPCPTIQAVEKELQ